MNEGHRRSLLGTFDAESCGGDDTRMTHTNDEPAVVNIMKALNVSYSEAEFLFMQQQTFRGEDHPKKRLRTSDDKSDDEKSRRSEELRKIEVRLKELEEMKNRVAGTNQSAAMTPTEPETTPYRHP